MPTVTFRCSDMQKAELEERGRGNTTRYILDRLFGSTEPNDLLHQILERLDDGTGRESVGGLGVAERGLLVELLLLMRMSVKPDIQKQAQAEVERVGLPVWASETHRRK